MSLSGNLGFVSLDEVLRLLIRSGQRGCVSVRGNGVDGRVFVTRGGINLATTTSDDGLQTLFRKSQLVDQGQITSGNLEGADAEVVELIREITVESIYQLNLHGDSFDVSEGAEARYGSPRPFELEQVLEASRKRLEDWAEVSQVVSSLDSRLAFLRDLGDREEVKIKRDAWKVLSEVGAGASVSEIARELGTTEFWAARVVARLVKDDLLTDRAKPAGESGYEAQGAEEPDYEAASQYEPEWMGDQSVEDSESMPSSEQAEEDRYDPVSPIESGYDYGDVDEDGGMPVEQPVAEVEEAGAPTSDWADTQEQPVWDETSRMPGVEANAEETAEAEIEMPVAAVEEAEGLDPNTSWWQEPEDEHDPADSVDEEPDDDGEEDTEAFLEKVFSELDRSDEGEEEGYGLLRRRRLGAMRDIARDS